jgi:hypothetical protein
MQHSRFSRQRSAARVSSTTSGAKSAEGGPEESASATPRPSMVSPASASLIASTAPGWGGRASTTVAAGSARGRRASPPRPPRVGTCGQYAPGRRWPTSRSSSRSRPRSRRRCRRRGGFRSAPASVAASPASCGASAAPASAAARVIRGTPCLSYKRFRSRPPRLPPGTRTAHRSDRPLGRHPRPPCARRRPMAAAGPGAQARGGPPVRRELGQLEHALAVRAQLLATPDVLRGGHERRPRGRPRSTDKPSARAEGSGAVMLGSGLRGGTTPSTASGARRRLVRPEQMAGRAHGIPPG